MRRDAAARSRRFHWWALGVIVLIIPTTAVTLAEEARLVGDRAERASLVAFAEQPADALTGSPGTLVKSEPLIGVPYDADGWRIMYRSTDVHGAPVVSTGILVTPRGPAPAGGRTVVSWGHPTTGSASDCAPSLGFDPYIGIEGMRILLDRGYAVVATDYTGMGTTGPDSYLVGVTEGHNVLDAARAARAAPAAQAGSDLVLWGHSQGGQAALFAAQLAADYAPELTLRAVAVAAPAADLTALMSSHLGDVSGVTIGSYAFSAFASVYADRGANVADILTPAAQGILPQMNSLCLLTHTSELHQLADPVVGKFVTSDPTTREPWATLLRENSAGAVGFAAPLLVIQGLKDELVLPADTQRYVQRARELGVTVTYHPIDSATHGTVAYLGLPALSEWLDSQHL